MRERSQIRRARRKSGFSLVELLIVAAIIFLIAAIAVPRLFTARNKANEASAVASMKVVRTAEAMYQSSYPEKGYSASLANLGSNGSSCETTSPSNACLIDPVLASGLKNGYIFDLVGDGRTPDLSYTLKATPQSSNDGGCLLLSDQGGVIQAMSATPPPQGMQGGGSSGEVRVVKPAIEKLLAPC